MRVYVTFHYAYHFISSSPDTVEYCDPLRPQTHDYSQWVHAVPVCGSRFLIYVNDPLPHVYMVSNSSVMQTMLT